MGGKYLVKKKGKIKLTHSKLDESVKELRFSYFAERNIKYKQLSKFLNIPDDSASSLVNIYT